MPSEAHSKDRGIKKQVYCLSIPRFYTLGHINTMSILGEDVEVVEDYRYLAVHMDNKLNWKCNTETVYKKGQNRLYFSGKLWSFIVCTKTYMSCTSL